MKSFSERASYCLNPTAQKLFKLMDLKQTNLALAADVTSTAQLLQLADTLGPYICLLKTHIDILNDFTPQLPHQLQELAEKHRFFLFEDRKFADIGHTVKEQYQGGLYRISDWADLVTAHIISGPGILEGLKQAGLAKGRGVILLAQMSSHQTLAKGAYTCKAIEWAKAHAEMVVGFICTRQLTEEPQFLHLTPGVGLRKGKDGLGQCYLTVQEVIEERGSDVIIVGRGIYEETDPVKAAEHLRQESWKCHQKRLVCNK